MAEASAEEPAAAEWSERLDLAQRLLAAGLLWSPEPGDRFIIPVGEMAGELYYVAEMTIIVHGTPTGRVLGFNGTTEWALDSLALTDVVWLPREDQLREALGDRFVALRHDDGWHVDVRLENHTITVTGVDPEQAYGHAVLTMLRSE